jgi:23S rRNA (guanosine2251-2'-O)-methyltransferase
MSGAMTEYLTGYHTIEETLKHGGVKGTLLISREGGRVAELSALAARILVPVSEVDESELDQLTGGRSHKGAVLALERASSSIKGDLRHRLAALEATDALVLVLDGITDPQNLGAILRSADQFRVDLVVLPSRRSAQETQTVSRVSSGASVYVPLSVVPNIPSALESIKKSGFWVYGADVEGQSIAGSELKGRVCLVMGSEWEGMRRLVRERCDRLVRIPSAGHVDSFNVSVAAGILMYEVRRQQGFSGS